MKRKQNVRKQLRKLTVSPDYWKIPCWFNFKTGKFEAYAKPETDEAALAHMPQDGFVEPVYRALRGQGFSILAAMRECFIKIEEMRGEREAKTVA